LTALDGFGFSRSLRRSALVFGPSAAGRAEAPSKSGASDLMSVSPCVLPLQFTFWERSLRSDSDNLGFHEGLLPLFFFLFGFPFPRSVINRLPLCVCLFPG